MGLRGPDLALCCAWVVPNPALGTELGTAGRTGSSAFSGTAAGPGTVGRRIKGFPA